MVLDLLTEALVYSKQSGQVRPDSVHLLSPARHQVMESCHHLKGCLFLHLINLQTDRSKTTYESRIFSKYKTFSEMQPSENVSLFYWIEF